MPAMKEITASGIRWQQFDLKRRKLPKVESRFPLLLLVGAVLLPAALAAVAHEEAVRVVAALPQRLLPRGSKQVDTSLRRN
jgi:hypothetical protein